jgi:hypothetical protein
MTVQNHRLRLPQNALSSTLQGLKGRKAEVPYFIQNVSAILHNAEVRSRPTNKKWWTDDQTNGQLAMMKKIFILKHSLRIANSPIAAHKQLQHSLYQRLKSAQCLPRRKGGRSTRDDRSKDFQLWDELTSLPLHVGTLPRARARTRRVVPISELLFGTLTQNRSSLEASLGFGAITGTPRIENGGTFAVDFADGRRNRHNFYVRPDAHNS